MFQTFPNHQPAIYFDTIRGASGLSKVGDLPAISSAELGGHQSTPQQRAARARDLSREPKDVAPKTWV